MLGLNASPNITRFAKVHNVTHQSVSDVLKLVFGEDVDMLIDIQTELTDTGILVVNYEDNQLMFTVETLEFPVPSTGSLTKALGFLESRDTVYNKLYILVKV